VVSHCKNKNHCKTQETGEWQKIGIPKINQKIGVAAKSQKIGEW